MIVSIFNDWKYAVWVDYSKKKDFEEIIEITPEEIENMKKWASILDWKVIVSLEQEVNSINAEFDAEILEYFTNNGYSQAERETFSIQEDEANYIDGKSKPSIKESLFIRTLAEARWEDFQELASKIKVKAEESKVFIAKKLAEKQLKIKQLQDASN